MVLRLLSLISGGYIIQSESTGGHQAQKRKSVVNPVEKDEDRAYSTADGVHVGFFFFFFQNTFALNWVTIVITVFMSFFVFVSIDNLIIQRSCRRRNYEDTRLLPSIVTLPNIL